MNACCLITQRHQRGFSAQWCKYTACTSAVTSCDVYQHMTCLAHLPLVSLTFGLMDGRYGRL
jgi:hypothetical protein